MKYLSCIVMGLVLAQSAFAVPEVEIRSNQDAVKRLIPLGGSEAIWESECKFGMKGMITVRKNRSFRFELQSYASTTCEKGSEYIQLSRSGIFNYKDAEYTTYNGDYYSSTYQTKPKRLELNMSHINYQVLGDQSFLGTVTEAILDMYKGCFGDEQDQSDNGGCRRKTNIEKTKADVRTNRIEFISPITFKGEFSDDVTIEFNLKQ